MKRYKKVAIVTGVSGFIGNRLAIELISKGYKVYGVSRSESTIISDRYIHCKGDLMSNDIYDYLCDVIEPDFFFHFAWEGVVGDGSGDYKIQIKNINMSCYCVELAFKIKCKKFIFAGSIFEYENINNKDISYDTSNKNKLYGYSKFAAHQMCLTIADSNRMKFNSCLISNVFGEGEKNPRFIKSLVNALKNDAEMKLTSCDQLYDFIYIHDAVEQIIEVAESGENLDEYYIGYGEIRPLIHYVNIIRDIVNPDYELKIGANKNKSTYFDYNQFEVSKLRDQTGLTPKYNFIKGIEKLLNN